MKLSNEVILLIAAVLVLGVGTVIDLSIQIIILGLVILAAIYIYDKYYRK